MKNWREAIETPGRITVDVLYQDHEHGQPTITRFVLLPEEAGSWRCGVTRHSSLRDQPKDCVTLGSPESRVDLPRASLPLVCSYDLHAGPTCAMFRLSSR